MPVKKSIEARKIVLIGAGSVAGHLGQTLAKKHKIIQVWSRTEQPARELARLLKSSFTTSLKSISAQADFYIVAVKDDALASVADSLRLKKGFVLHTSGTLSLDVLKNCSAQTGVLYPLQTFSRNSKPDMQHCPLCLEANSSRNEKILLSFARSLSDNLHILNSEHRKALHLAAVFSSNFSNHMFSIAYRIVKKEKLPFSLLIPLIEETVNKLKRMTPNEAQTGPAIRKDEKIIKQHLKMLENDKTAREIYKLISRSIGEDGSKK